MDDGAWKYVFCYNPTIGLVYTDKKRKGLHGAALDYFKNKYSDREFRVI